ncbi:MAG: type II toxin-antitoxin system VapB family antitoxin [Kiloniellaceae bacterium]
MSLNIKSAEADRLARELSRLTGETITDAVTRALEERLERRQREGDAAKRAARAAAIDAICRRAAGLPVLDTRSSDEILGYDERGVWS